MLESKFQKDLKDRLKKMFPGCIILKNDANSLQGIPDLLILYNEHWAMLETKRQEGAKRRPNQPYYIDKLNRMSFAAFIEPENEEEVLCELQRSFGICGTTRLPLCVKVSLD